MKATFFAVPAKVDFHDILTSLSLSLSLSVFFFSTSVKNNIIFYKFAVDPKRAKQIIKKDIKVLPWLGICFLIKFLSWCSHNLRSMAVLSSWTHYGFPSSNWYQTDNDWHQVLSMSLIYSCTEQTLRVSKNIEIVFSEYCWTDPLKEIG